MPSGPKFSVNDFLSRDFWLGLCPHLSIEGNGSAPLPSLPPIEGLVATLRHEGYINVPDVFPTDYVKRVRDGISLLHHRGIPPLFAFVFDEYWLIPHRLAPLLSAVLGDDYVIPRRPTICAWYVEPSDDAAGWKPHRDNPKPPLVSNGLPQSLTVWLPFSDATVLNGCMYVVPAHLDEAFKTGEYAVPADVPVTTLQNIRALPATAGSLLAWNQSLLHWGARASRMGSGPRCSMACEFQRASLVKDSAAQWRPEVIPSFSARLGLLGYLLQEYERFQRHDPMMKLIASALDWKHRPQ